MKSTIHPTSKVRWLQSRIPPVSAKELGVFRLLFAVAVALTLHELRLPEESFPRELHLTNHRLADWEWVHAIAERPDVVVRIEDAAIVLAALFGVGILTRVSFAALVTTLTVWTLVRLTHTGAHSWAALLVTCWAMLPVRWGDGFSVDALVRKWRGRPRDTDERRVSYGYALWIPGLVFGAAMLAASVAKLHSGIAWITNGTVKYFFVIDAANAPTDWGLWVAARHPIAVLLSAGAIIGEGTLILAVLCRSYVARLPFALMGLGLLVGFYVFQNELWYAWWTLYLAFFVPWPHLVRTVARRATPFTSADHDRLTVAQWCAIAIVLGLQITGIVLRTEVSPIMSDYPMYSTTYASIEEFERRAALSPQYHFTVRFADGSETFATDVVDRLQLGESLREVVVRLTEGREVGKDEHAAVRASGEQLSRHYGEPVIAIIVLVDQRGFDWQKGKFSWRAIRKPVHTFDIPQ